MSKQNSTRDTFGIVDIVRLLSGLLLLNAIASWWFTSTSTWGYKGKWINPRYLKFRAVGRPLVFEMSELAKYNGADSTLPIYLAINGSVYDVTASRHMYGPKGPYRFFSGRDATRAFVTGCFQNPDEFTHDLRGLDPDEINADVKSWRNFFETSQKYWYVGKVLLEPVSGEPPSPCTHQKFPRGK